MKGYLQRMAQNAVRSQGGIHPIVGSIYSGTALAGAAFAGAAFAGAAFAERGPATDSVAVTEEHLLASSSETARARKDLREIKSAAMQFDIAHPKEVPEEQMEERPAGARRAEPAPFRPLLSHAKNEPAAGKKEAGRFDDEGDESPGAREFHYEPLLPHEAHSPLVTAAVKAAKHDPVSRSARAEREPDKIEIHIGRIEVTAVPQEAPRPATARARKSLNLGEYLKRRDGRTG